jgi:outer membrane lipase/esterase
MRRTIAAAVLVLAGFGVPSASASSLNFFTSFWVFGDSLSDPGNLFAATGGSVPPDPPYYDGRVSNGPVWAEYLQANFDKAGLPNDNYAHAYANALEDVFTVRPIGDPFVKDLSEQLGQFTTESVGLLGNRPLATLLFGANDLFFSGIPFDLGAEIGAAAANAVADGALFLQSLGVNDVMLFTLPPIDLTPSYALPLQPGAEQAKIGTEAFNTTLLTRISGLETAGLNVLTLDLFDLFGKLVANPEDYGVLDATYPCFIPGFGFFLGCSPETAPERAFFDPVHPNNVIHEQIAGLVREQVAPVPLPLSALLLIGGIAGLGLMRRRAA